METYVGENHPKSNGVAWIHHDTYNDINSPLVLEVSKSGKYTEVQSAKTLKKIADLQESKADLVNGTVPQSQLPPLSDYTEEVATYSALPVTGDVNILYVTLDTGLKYRWTGSIYINSDDPIAYATQVEAEGNVENTKVMTALRTYQNFLKNSSSANISTLNTSVKNVIGAINELYAGKFDKTSIVQTNGSSTTTAMSQKAVTYELISLNHSYINTLNSPILFSTTGGVTKARITSPFLILDSKGVTLRADIPAQEVEVPNAYGCIVAVLDKSDNSISPTLKGILINQSNSIEEGKNYIPIYAWSYISESNAGHWAMTFGGDFRDALINYHLSWDSYNNTLAGGTALYGTYIPIKCGVTGFYCRINSVDSDLIVYRFNIKTNEYSILKTFAKETLSTGISYLSFDKAELIGEDEQFMISGKIGYSNSANDYTERTLNFYTNNPDKIIVSYTALKLAICYKLDFSMNPSKVISRIPVQSERMIDSVKTVMDIDSYNSTLNNVGYVGKYIPTIVKVTEITLNVRTANEPIDIALLDIANRTLTSIKSVTPTTTGVTTIAFDTPVDVNYTKQIVVHGKIGYIYSASILKGLSGNQISYNYSGNGTIIINPISLVDFSVSYTFESPLSYNDYINNSIDYALQSLYNIEQPGPSDYKTIIVNVADYGNNLRTVFSNIIPSESVHYTVLIPEGTYNVDSWFTEEEKAVEDNSFRGLELPNYVKLLGVGAKEKIILQWINTSATNRGFISTLNTHEWHELENLTVIGENIRYAVHDDLWNGLARYLRVTNCEFKVTDCSRAWGAGHNGGYDGEFIDCKFSVYKNRGNMDTMTYIEPFELHDNQYNAGNSKVLLSNCRFYNAYTDHPCVNFGMSSNDGITYARIIGCKMNTNVFLGAGTGENEGIINCRVTGFGNIMGVTPAISANAIKSIDTLIDLIP